MTEMLLYLESLFSVARYTSHYTELFQTLHAMLLIACVISFGANRSADSDIILEFLQSCCVLFKHALVLTW